MISKTIPELRVFLFFLILLLSPMHAEEADTTRGPRGFVRLLNAVGAGTGKLEFLINGVKVREEGYEFGDVTGGIPRKPMTYKVAFRREGVRTGETAVDLHKDATITLIPFAEFVPATEKAEAYWKMRILKLKPMDAGYKRAATFVNVTREPELKIEMQQMNGDWESLVIHRLGLERTSIQQKSGYVPVKCKGKDLTAISVGTSGNFVSVLYENAKGEIQSQCFQDHKYLSAE